MAHEQSKIVLSQREKKRIENRRDDLKDGMSVPFFGTRDLLTWKGTGSNITNFTVGYD